MITHKGLTAFVVDDNPTALETLANDLRNAPEFSAVFTFSNYADATLPMLEEQPDVLFMDVEVPGKSGLDFCSPSVHGLTSTSRLCSTPATPIT